MVTDKFITPITFVRSMAGKKKQLTLKDVSPTQPLIGAAGELYPKDCFLWKQQPNEAVVHDVSQKHNTVTKKFMKGAKVEAGESAERDAFIAHLQFIAFGTTPSGSPIYPKLIDLSKTPKDQASAVNAVIAYMQAHFQGVGAQDLRAQVIGK